MILTNFGLQPDIGAPERVYIEPVVGMMVRDLATGEDWVVGRVDNSAHTMRLRRFTVGQPDEAREDVDYARGGFLLAPGRNGEREWKLVTI